MESKNEEEETRDYRLQGLSNWRLPESRERQVGKGKKAAPGRRRPAGTIWQPTRPPQRRRRSYETFSTSSKVTPFATLFRMAPANRNPCTRRHVCLGCGGARRLQPVPVLAEPPGGPPLSPSTVFLSTVLPSPTSQSHIPLVRSCRSLFRVLLVAVHGGHETGFLDALHERWSQQNETACELVGTQAGFLKVLLMLDLIRVWIFLRRCTWHRPPTHGPESATAAQTSSHSDRGSIRWGFAVFHHSSKTKVDQSNREVETVTWFLEQATLCTNKSIKNPSQSSSEDSGGHEHAVPASILGQHSPTQAGRSK